MEDAALGKVREQFYRLDKRAVGYLSMESYNELLMLKEGGAKKRWQFAASTLLRERRIADVAGALHVGFTSEKSHAEARAQRESRMSFIEHNFRSSSVDDDDNDGRHDGPGVSLLQDQESRQPSTHPSHSSSAMDGAGVSLAA